MAALKIHSFEEYKAYEGKELGTSDYLKITQEQIDKFTYDLLKAVIESPNLKTKIESVRSGGQTGFDEAGAKAGIKLGLLTIVLAPKGWTFRNINGQDISNEQQFDGCRKAYSWISWIKHK